MRFLLARVLSLLNFGHVTYFVYHSTAMATEQPQHSLSSHPTKVAITGQLLAEQVTSLNELVSHPLPRPCYVVVG